MKFILCLLLLIQIQKCKPENVAISQFDGKERLKDQKSHIDTYLINFVEKSLIGSEILDQKKITELKNTLKIALSRQTERPYMWDVFVSSNSDLLQFYDYKVFTIENSKFTSYYFKINYEDGKYEGIILLNENSSNEYNSMIVYEELKSEENYQRTTKIEDNQINIKFASSNDYKNLTFKMVDGVFLDYFDEQKIDQKWGRKEKNDVFEYELKGDTKSHLKNGYWIEKKYSVEYGKNVIEDGNYNAGIRNGEWNFSVDGPVDQIKTYDKGKVIKTLFL